MNIDLLDTDNDAQEERLLKDAFKQTISAMDGSKGQIFEIYENTKNDVESTRVLLKELKEQTRQYQDEVDELVPVSRYWEGGYPTPQACALDYNNHGAVHRACNQWRGNRSVAEVLAIARGRGGAGKPYLPQPFDEW